LEPKEPGPGRQQTIRVAYEDLIFHTVFHPTCTVVARTAAVRQALVGDTLCSDHTQLMGDVPLWLELCQMGSMVRLGEKLASYRLSPNSSMRQGDPLHCWRFEISHLDVRYQALERYPLPGDPKRTWETKANFVWQMTLRSAWVGDAGAVRKQFRRLRALGGRVGWKQAACLVLALTPLPRRPLMVLARRITGRLQSLGLDPRKHFLSEVLRSPHQ